MHRQTFGYAPRYLVQTGVAEAGSFRWANEGEFLRMADAVAYAQLRTEAIDIRITTADGGVLWNKRDSDVWLNKLPTPAMAATIANEQVELARALEFGNSAANTTEAAR